MKIAIDLRLFRLPGTESSTSYLENLLSRLANDNPSTEFFFLFDAPYSKRLVFSSNVTPIILKPKASSALLWKYWYNYKLPRFLIDHHVDCFVGATGICSGRTAVAQVLFIQDLAFLKRPADLSRKEISFIKSLMPLQLQKVNKVLVMTGAVKNEILEVYKTPADKIAVIPGAASDGAQALPWYEREYTKDKYAGGKDYFLFDGYIDQGTNMMSLIKAFSQFKKWQQSNMKLLLVGTWSESTHDILEQLESFRFRDDVVLIESATNDTRAKLLAAAYAIVDPSQYAGFGMHIPDAMRSETPIICSDLPAFRETAGDAAAYFETGNADALAEMLKKIYKDETWRQSLIDHGKEKGGQFSYEDSAVQFMQEIIHATKGHSA